MSLTRTAIRLQFLNVQRLACAVFLILPLLFFNRLTAVVIVLFELLGFLNIALTMLFRELRRNNVISVCFELSAVRQALVQGNNAFCITLFVFRTTGAFEVGNLRIQHFRIFVARLTVAV